MTDSRREDGGGRMRHEPASDEPRAVRRAYNRPRLIEYGSVAKLTQGTRTKQADAPGAGFRMACL